MNIQQILSILPAAKLKTLAIETKVNHKAKKLDGIIVFKLLLYSILQVKQNSLRTMETIFNSYAFRKLHHTKTKEVKYNSISDRLTTINPLFFEKLYQYCIQRFSSCSPAIKDNVIRFDSTLLSLSSKLIDFGFQAGGHQQHVRQLKFTIGYSEAIPAYACFHHEPKYNSENIALKEAIFNCTARHNKIVLFDRGIGARDTYDQLAEENVFFITRIDPNCRYSIVKPNKLKQPIESNELSIKEDMIIQLYNKQSKITKHVFRYITASQKASGETLGFITNITHLSSNEITEIYKKRWDIEVFFKFLKQELNFSHLVNRSTNGIQVLLYTTLICSILLSIYKKQNKLKGYKQVKLKFVQELETELIKHIVKLCGGNPDKLSHQFRAASAFW